MAIPVSGFAIAGQNARGYWNASPGQTYNVYRSRTLAAGSWELLDILTTPTEFGEFIEPIEPGGRAFFRIEWQP